MGGSVLLKFLNFFFYFLGFLPTLFFITFSLTFGNLPSLDCVIYFVHVRKALPKHHVFTIHCGPWIVFPCGNFFLALTGKFMFFQILNPGKQFIWEIWRRYYNSPVVIKALKVNIAPLLVRRSPWWPNQESRKHWHVGLVEGEIATSSHWDWITWATSSQGHQHLLSIYLMFGPHRRLPLHEAKNCMSYVLFSFGTLPLSHLGLSGSVSWWVTGSVSLK